MPLQQVRDRNDLSTSNFLSIKQDYYNALLRRTNAFRPQSDFRFQVKRICLSSLELIHLNGSQDHDKLEMEEVVHSSFPLARDVFNFCISRSTSSAPASSRRYVDIRYTFFGDASFANMDERNKRNTTAKLITRM